MHSPSGFIFCLINRFARVEMPLSPDLPISWRASTRPRYLPAVDLQEELIHIIRQNSNKDIRLPPSTPISNRTLKATHRDTFTRICSIYAYSFVTATHLVPLAVWRRHLYNLWWNFKHNTASTRPSLCESWRWPAKQISGLGGLSMAMSTYHCYDLQLVWWTSLSLPKSRRLHHNQALAMFCCRTEALSSNPTHQVLCYQTCCFNPTT